MQPIFALGLPHGLEWVWIFLAIVLLFGADKIPKLARGFGRSLGEFKKAKEEFEREVHSATTNTAETKPEQNEPKIAGTLPEPVTPTSSATTVASDGLTKKI